MSDRNENRPGYKKTKIGWIPEEWEFKPLECICAKVTDGTHDTPQRKSTGIPLLTTKNLRNGKLVIDDDYYITKYDFIQINKRSEVSANDILYGMIGTIGSPVRIEKILKPFAVKNMAILKFGTYTSESIWTYFFLSSPRFQRYIDRQLSGNAQKFISLGFVRNLKIPLPSLPEQKKIAEILSTWDRAIEQVGKLIDAKQRLKKGLMQKLLTGRMRFPEFGKPASKKDKMPKGWKEALLGDIVEVNMGTSPPSESYNKTNFGLPLIQGNADIVGRKTAPTRWTSEITTECFPGELIMTVRAPVGEIAKSVHHACIGRGVCVIRPGKDANSNFIYQLLLKYETKWKRFGQGSTFTCLTGKDVRNYKLSVPHESEQHRIAAVLESCDREIELLRKKQAALKQQKKGSMQKLLTGEVRVK